MFSDPPRILVESALVSRNQCRAERKHPVQCAALIGTLHYALR